jgi:predicted transcriptional regulator of viral defense system
LSLPHGNRSPRVDHPPLRVHLFSKEAFLADIEERNVDGVPVRIYDAEKTLADCFKFRHKIGQDMTIEALRVDR